jgi:copper chaperone CopZ
MRKVFKLEDLECAHCAAKMEDKIRKLPGVISVSVNFLSGKLTLEAEDGRFEELLSEAERIIKRIEPDCRVLR